MKPTLTILLMTCLFAACTSTRQSPTPISTPSPLPCEEPGTVKTLKVDGFGDIGVYLPPCYEQDPSQKYPVLYLLPGFGGTHMEWLDIGIASLTDEQIKKDVIHPFIIVTTDNTYDAILPETIIQVLIPYMETNYRASPDRTKRAIAGGSLGGASAYLLTFQHPYVFASAGVFGNGLVTGQEEQDAAWLQGLPPELKPRIFLNSGEQDTFMLQQAKALIPILDEYGIQHAEIFSEGGHSTVYWLSNFPAFYKWLSEDWQE